MKNNNTNINIVTLKGLIGQTKHKKQKPINVIKPEPETEYPALIMDSTYDEDDNVVKVSFTVFIDGKTFPYTARFNLSTNASYYFDSMVEIVGDEDGNFIGKLCYVVFHQNQKFLNIEVISEATEEELGIDTEIEDEEESESKQPKALSTANKIHKAEIMEADDEDDEVEFDDNEVED